MTRKLPPNRTVVWRDTEYEDLIVSETGLVWNTRLGQYIKPVTQRNGLQVLKICRSKLKVSKTIAKLVYETFKGPVPEGYVVYHKDNIKENNFIGNLGIMHKSQFQKANSKMNCGRRIDVIDENGEVIKRYRSMKEYAEKNYVSTQTLIDYRRGLVKNPRSIQHTLKFHQRGKVADISDNE